MMKSNVECLLCGLKQVLNTMNLTNESEEKIKDVLSRASKHLFSSNLNDSPAKIISPVYKMIYDATKNTNPYKDKKIESNKFAMSLYNDVYDMVGSSEDPLYAAAKASAIGNVMDMGIGYYKSDIEKLINEEIHKRFDIDDFEDFKSDMDNKEFVLYLGDNSGEIVFDKIFIIELSKRIRMPVYYIVKGAPIINDVTIEDAEYVGMNEICNVRDNGSGLIGTQLDDISPDLKKMLLNKSALVISKGQGNFETLYNTGIDVYFILKAKCSVIANIFKSKIGDSIFYHQKL